MRILALTPILLAACGKPPVTLIPVPDQDNRVEVSTNEPGWEARVADLTACVLRVDHPGTCTQPNPPVCDTRSKQEVLRTVQPILDSLPKVKLIPFAVNRDLRALFPGATPSSEVLDARRKTACMDWADGACAAIRTAAIAFVFEGPSGAAPERILIVQVAPACRQTRPDRESGP